MSIFEFAPVALERVAGAELEYDDFERAYLRHCEVTSGRALTPAEAVEQTNVLCRDYSIPIDRQGKDRFLIGVRLKTANVPKHLGIMTKRAKT